MITYGENLDNSWQISFMNWIANVFISTSMHITKTGIKTELWCLSCNNFMLDTNLLTKWSPYMRHLLKDMKLKRLWYCTWKWEQFNQSDKSMIGSSIPLTSSKKTSPSIWGVSTSFSLSDSELSDESDESSRSSAVDTAVFLQFLHKQNKLQVLFSFLQWQRFWPHPVLHLHPLLSIFWFESTFFIFSSLSHTTEIIPSLRHQAWSVKSGTFTDFEHACDQTWSTQQHLCQCNLRAVTEGIHSVSSTTRWKCPSLMVFRNETW